MITNNKLKYYSSLLQKKYRLEENKFLVEGIKSVAEGLNSDWKCEAVFVINDFIVNNPDQFSEIENSTEKIYTLSNQQFQKISDTKTPQGIAAVFLKKRNDSAGLISLKENILVYLDEISDPGNLGTILRTCDWFGIKSVLMSENCVEFTNPKTVRASMGSIFHLNIYEEVDQSNLEELKRNEYKFLTADIKGESIFDLQIPKKIVISFSNETEGPSQKILQVTDIKITIPKIGKAESLNVASAAGIILAHLIK